MSLLTLKRYLETWLAHIRYGLMREMMFRWNFLLWIVVETMWLALNLTFIEVIYGHVNSIAGWSKYQMMMLAGTHYAIQQLFQSLSMSGLFGLFDYIRTGNLDFYLLKPINPQFLISIHKFDPGGILNFIIGLAVVYVAALKLGICVTFWNLILFSALILVGLFIHYALLLLVVSITFWITQGMSVMMGYYTFTQLARIPKDAAKGIIRVVFTYAIPMFLVANVPAQALQGIFSITTACLIVGVTCAFTAFATFIFKVGLKNYRSASS